MSINAIQGGGVTNIDATVLGNTTLYTTENGTEKWRMAYIFIELVDVNPPGTSGGQFQIGTNSPNFDNISVSTGLVMLYPNDYVEYMNEGVFTVVPPNTAIVFKVISTNVNATIYTVDVSIWGTYDS